MRKTNNQTKKLQLNTESIRLLKTEELAAVHGGGTTTTYKVSEGCISESCYSHAC